MSGRSRGGEPRVGFYGRLGSGNYGNDGSFEGLLLGLRRYDPGIVADVMCSGPDTVSRRYGLPAVPMHWDLGGHEDRGGRMARRVRTALRVGTGVAVDAWRTARWTRGHDAVVVPGMGTFESSLPVRPWQVPWGLFALAASGRLLGVPVAFVDVGVSPLPGRVTRALLVGALRGAAHRSYRDEYSRDVAASLGVDTSADEVLPDLAFVLAAPGGAPVEHAVGVGVMAWNGATRDKALGHRRQERYEEVVVGLVRWLLDEGYGVRVFAGDDDDAEVARRVVSAVGAARQGQGEPADLRYEAVATLGEVVERMSVLRAVVGTRYHNVVGALLAGRPALAVAYSQKHRALLEQYGLGEHCHDIADLDLARLRRSLQAVLADEAAVADAVTERTWAARRALEGRL
ncbi:MAG TPA: polysaccharide pyruvyl transferase family protein, partial [Phycicoccus sp.]